MVLNVKVSEIKFVYFFYLSIKQPDMLIIKTKIIYEIQDSNNNTIYVKYLKKNIYLSYFLIKKRNFDKDK